MRKNTKSKSVKYWLALNKKKETKTMIIKTNETLNFIGQNQDDQFVVTCIEDAKILAIFTFTVVHDRLFIDEIQFGDDYNYCAEQAERLWEQLKDLQDDDLDKVNKERYKEYIQKLKDARQVIEIYFGEHNTIIKDMYTDNENWTLGDRMEQVEHLAKIHNTLEIIDTAMELYNERLK